MALFGKLTVDASDIEGLNLPDSTGWLSGGVITINGSDPAKFDYTSGTGLIVDASDPTNITKTPVSWTGAVGVPLTFLATNAGTFFSIDIGGVLLQNAGFPIGGALRDFIQLGGALHGDNASISAVTNFTSAMPFQIAPSMTDFMSAIGVIQGAGNDFSGSGNANLKFMKSAGNDVYWGIDPKPDPDDGNRIVNAILNEPDIVFSWRDGSGGHTTTVSDAITAGVYDDGTGGATEPNGTVTTNNWVNCRIKFSPDLSGVVIEYGDNTYNSSANAVANLRNDTYGDNPTFIGFPIRTYVTVRGALTNTDIVADAVFNQTNKFGDI